MQILARHTPNTMPFSYPLDTGTVVTVFKSVPGDTAPRLQMQVPGGNPVDCGAIDRPERFGSYDTPKAFASWVQAFATSA